MHVGIVGDVLRAHAQCMLSFQEGATLLVIEFLVRDLCGTKKEKNFVLVRPKPDF